MLVRDTTNNKTKILEVAGSTLSTADSSAHSKLDTINATLSAGIDVTDSAVASALGGTLTVSDSTAQGKLDTINTTLSGTLSVSSGVPSRTNGNLANAASKSAGDVSSSVNGTNYKTGVIFGSCSSMTGSVRIQVSHDNSNFYEDHNSRFYANSTNGHFVGRFTLDAPYFKVEFMDTATYTMEYALCS